MTVDTILHDLHQLANADFKSGMARFGIANQTALGIKVPELRAYAKKAGKNHDLALQLWQFEIHEAQLLAIFMADAKQVTEELMEQWVKDFDSWDICDQCCGWLFDKTPYAFDKAVEWTSRTNEFEKRAGFVMMAELAMHAKKAIDQDFEPFFPLMIKHADDERNFVKKAVNWALRQIGKRNTTLNTAAIKVAQEILTQPSKSAKWIAIDAIRELEMAAKKKFA